MGRPGVLLRIVFVVCIGMLGLAIIANLLTVSQNDLHFNVVGDQSGIETYHLVSVGNHSKALALKRHLTGSNAEFAPVANTTHPLLTPGTSASPPLDSLDPLNAHSPYWLAPQQLLPDLIPATVHYLWCGRRHFLFKHYLSVVSVIRAIRPDGIWIHYEQEPVVDTEYYYQWIDLLKKEYPYITLAQMTPMLAVACSAEHAKQVSLIARLLDEMGGGLYVSENTWLLRFDSSKRRVDVEYALEPHKRDGYLLLRAGQLKRHGRSLESIRRNAARSKSASCSTVRHLYNGETQSSCLTVNGGRYTEFYPKDVWDLDDVFGRIARRIFYGTEAIRKPKPSYDELVPNIAHMVWIGGGKMDFTFYLSVLSLLYVAKVDTVYIHGDMPPSGELWKRIERDQSRVRFIRRNQLVSMYQNYVEYYYRPLMSDIIRVELMIRYGGIYTDTDAIWVRPLTRQERGYDAVATFDWVDWSYPYPDIVNFGVSYGKRNAPFWRLFRDSMRVMHNAHHGYTGVSMPYKLLELHPDLLHIDTHLSAICYELKCHPTYVDDYHNEDNNHVSRGTIRDWRTDLHAFHWTHPSPPEFANESSLITATGMFAEIGQNVLRRAGLL